MKIIFMGTPDFAAVSLQALLDSGVHDIALVVTQPDRPKGRGQKLQPSAVKSLALQYALPVYQPEKLDTADGYEYLKSLQPDLIVAAAYGQILSRRILDLPVYGCINVHASLLPLYRGAAPIHRAVIEGREETGVTIMKMAEELDAGDMYEKEAVTIEAEDTLGIVHDKLAFAGGRLLLKVIEQLAAGTAKAVKQDASLVTYAEKISKAETEIKWDLPAKAIHNLVRGTNPFPGAYTYLDNKRWKIHRTRIVPEAKSLLPGQILSDNDRLTVGTGEGALLLLEIQPENSKKMLTADYLKGHKISNLCMFGGK